MSEFKWKLPPGAPKPRLPDTSMRRAPENEDSAQWIVSRPDWQDFLRWWVDQPGIGEYRRPYDSLPDAPVRYHLRHYFSPTWVSCLNASTIDAVRKLSMAVTSPKKPEKEEFTISFDAAKLGEGIESAIDALRYVPDAKVNSVHDSLCIQLPRSVGKSWVHGMLYGTETGRIPQEKFMIAAQCEPEQIFEVRTLVNGRNIAHCSGDTLLEILGDLNKREEKLLDSGAGETKYVKAQLKEISLAKLAVTRRLNKLK